jgi:hypothetical protein
LPALIRFWSWPMLAALAAGESDPIPRIAAAHMSATSMAQAAGVNGLRRISISRGVGPGIRL